MLHPPGHPRLYPPSEPYAAGWLDPGDGQALYWEQCGSPQGRPAVVLHGGPGSGCTPAMRRLFDPRAYRVVLPDQRGAGRSRPHAGEPTVDLSVNTTGHLLADLERLRGHLAIDRWVVLGMSWGATLGLAYAEAHPSRVAALVLAPVTLTRPSDVDWLTRGVGRFFPAEWAAFRAGVPPQDRDGNLAAAYARLLASPDPGVRDHAARNWCAWEEALASPDTGGMPDPRYADPRFRLGFARLVTHYFAAGAWLGEDRLLAQAYRLRDVPGVLVAGRRDLSAPPLASWQLKQAWPRSEHTVLPAAGHSGPAMTAAVLAALDRLAGRAAG